MKKIVVLYDIHYPYNIDLKPVLNFMSDFKPDRIIFGGDILDLAYLSHWNELKPGKWKKKNLARDYEWMGSLLDNIKTKIKPKEMSYHIGNHEFWVEQFMDKFPYLDGTLNVKEGLHLNERGVNCYEFNKTEQIGKLYFLHGVYVNDAHAKKTLLHYQRNVRYGHTHDHQTYSMISPIDAHALNATSCGCLCNRNNEYMHGRPNRWMHGFYVAYIQKDGTFTDYFIPIVKNKFVWAGKTYE